MKTMKILAFSLLALTVLVIAGFTLPERQTATPAAQKDKKPSQAACTAVIDGKSYTVGYATDCLESANSTCVSTKCSTKTPDANMKPLIFRCVDNATKVTVAYASGCITSPGSHCAITDCPVNTSAISN